MRRVVFLRHTENADDVLTDAGVTEAMELAQQLAGQEFAIVVISGAQRTTQTAACLLATGSLRVPQGVVVHEGFGVTAGANWNEVIDVAGGIDAPALVATGARIVSNARQALAEALSWTGGRLEADGSALVISHSPLIELAVWDLTGKAVAPFSRGQWMSVDLER